MIIICPSCQTRFRLASDRIGPSGARIRCSACKAVFRLAPSGEVTPEGGAEAVRSPSGPDQATRTARPGPDRGDAALPGDPFAPAATAVPPPGDPLARARDPFADDPFTASLGPDPFSPGVPAMPPPLRVERAAEALQATVAAAAANPSFATPAIDPGALALEDSSPPPPPRASPPPLPAREPTPEPDFFRVAAASVADMPIREPDVESASPLRTPAPDHGPAPVPSAPEPVSRDAGASADVGGLTATAALPRLRRRTRVSTLAANSLSLGLLLALTAGLLAWRGDLRRSLRVATGRGGGDTVETAGVRAGLYDTSAGPAVLVVRGEVRSRGGARGPVRVRVALVEGSRTVASAEALAGASASPEEVFAISSAQDAAALRRAMDARAARGFPPGAAAPFLVLFPAPVPDLSGLEVRTTVDAAPGR